MQQQRRATSPAGRGRAHHDGAGTSSRGRRAPRVGGSHPLPQPRLRPYSDSLGVGYRRAGAIAAVARPPPSSALHPAWRPSPRKDGCTLRPTQTAATGHPLAVTARTPHLATRQLQSPSQLAQSHASLRHRFRQNFASLAHRCRRPAPPPARRPRPFQRPPLRATHHLVRAVTEAHLLVDGQLNALPRALNRPPLGHANVQPRLVHRRPRAEEPHHRPGGAHRRGLRGGAQVEQRHAARVTNARRVGRLPGRRRQDAHKEVDVPRRWLHQRQSDTCATGGKGERGKAKGTENWMHRCGVAGAGVHTRNRAAAARG